MPRRCFHFLSLLLALLGPGRAWADPYSLDIEMLQPGFSSQGLPGVDHPATDPGTLGLGFLGQHERDPLLLFEEGGEQGVVIHQRQALDLAVSYDVNKRLSTHMVLPLALQGGGELKDYAHEGFGMRDPRLGARFLVGQRGLSAIGLRGDMALPVGTTDAWLGEASPRVSGGLLLAVGHRKVELLADLGALGRGLVETDENLAPGVEVSTNLAFRYAVWPMRAYLWTGLLRRAAAEKMWQSAGENGTELLTGMHFMVHNDLRADLLVGKGLNQGYGTTEFRAAVGLTWQIGLTPELLDPPLPEVDVVGLDSWQDPALQPEEEDLGWGEGQLARIEESRIEIRDPIQFAVATAVILAPSIPTLLAVGELMEQNPNITMVLIEGHASEEGDHLYNYQLSNQRARSIYEALIGAGVHPTRLAYRGLGEIHPVVQGSDEASLAINRRVEFHIISQQDPLLPTPRYGPHYLPWELQARAEEETR